MLNRRHIQWDQFFRVLVPQFVERKRAAVGNLDRTRDQAWIAREQWQQLSAGLQMPFTIRKQFMPQ